MFVAVTLQEATQQLSLQLTTLYPEREARNIADWVMEHLTGWEKIDRTLNKQIHLSTQQEKLLHQYMEKLLNSTPIQYVLNESWFCGLKLYVNEQVLIPRPETEELVTWIISDYKNHENESVRALDIGTGSGCIPLALKKTFPAMEAHTLDISNGALEVARRNAREHHLEIDFHLLDFLSEKETEPLPLFDVIVSNPPYIPLRDKVSMASNVLNYEPHLALFVTNEDPLLFYKAIARFATTHLIKGGGIYLEIHEEHAQEVIEVFNLAGFKNKEIKKDLQARCRMVKINF